MSSSSPSPSCSPQADRAGDSWRSTAARRRTPRHDASVPLPPAPSPAFGSPRARSVLAANATLTTPWRPGSDGTRPARKGGRKLAGADRGALAAGGNLPAAAVVAGWLRFEHHVEGRLGGHRTALVPGARARAQCRKTPRRPPLGAHAPSARSASPIAARPVLTAGRSLAPRRGPALRP